MLVADKPPVLTFYHPLRSPHREENDAWVSEKLEAHTDWVRDVAWCPSVGLPRSRVASCSQVRLVWCGNGNGYCDQSAGL